MHFGLGLGWLGAQRRSGSRPTAPVLSLDHVSGFDVYVNADVDDTVVAGDTMRRQFQVSGGNWSSLVSDTTHTITSPEDTANQVDYGTTLVSAGDYDVRALVHHNTDSAWSNTVTFTITASNNTAVRISHLQF